MEQAAPENWKKKDARVTSAVPAPSAPLSKTQGSDCKLVGAVGGELQHGPWSPDSFDPGGQSGLFPPDPCGQWAVLTLIHCLLCSRLLISTFVSPSFSLINYNM